ncbi:MAG: FeoA domain-containing protein [Francisellaceae bacterium]
MQPQLNHRYKILGFSNRCPANYRHKLLSLGFLPGTIFTVDKSAPFGNPLQLSIRNFSISMRKSELALINIEEVK